MLLLTLQRTMYKTWCCKRINIDTHYAVSETFYECYQNLHQFFGMFIPTSAENSKGDLYDRAHLFEFTYIKK